MPTTIEHAKKCRGNTPKLARYLANEKKLDRKWGIEGVRYSNLGVCQNIERAIEKFHEIQKEAKLTNRDVNYHLIISFDSQDIVTHKIIRDCEDHCISRLGMKEYQRLSVIHTNTDNLHLHIQLNRVHPVERTREGYLRLHPLSYSYQKLRDARQVLEKKFHLTQTTSDRGSQQDIHRNIINNISNIGQAYSIGKSLSHKRHEMAKLIHDMRFKDIEKRTQLAQSLHDTNLISQSTFRALKHAAKQDNKELKMMTTHRKMKKRSRYKSKEITGRQIFNNKMSTSQNMQKGHDKHFNDNSHRSRNRHR